MWGIQFANDYWLALDPDGGYGTSEEPTYIFKTQAEAEDYISGRLLRYQATMTVIEEPK